MLYSDAIKSEPPVTLDTFPVRRKRQNRSRLARRIAVENNQSDNEEDSRINENMLAVQQLSETPSPLSQQSLVTTEFSWIWDKPGRNRDTKASLAGHVKIPSPAVRYATKTNEYQLNRSSPSTAPAAHSTPPTFQKRSSSHRRSSGRITSTNSHRHRSESRTQGPSSRDVRAVCTCDTPEGSWVPWTDSDGFRVDWVYCWHRELLVKPKPAPKKQKTTFLSLPGELRNQIYTEVLPECRILILQTHPNKESDILKNTWSTADKTHKRQRTRLYHKLDNSQIVQGLGITTNLLLACKKVRRDVELYLYSRTTFCFDSIKVLDCFMQRASCRGMQAIEKLEISHSGYGNTNLMENDRFHDKYYSAWGKACMAVGEKMTGLKHLKVNAHLRQWPCDLSQLGSDTQWHDTFLQMAPRRLAKVELILHHSMFGSNTRLMKDIAYKLAGDMMTDGGRHERDLIETKQVLAMLEAKKAAKIAKRKAAEAKSNAPTELTITMDQIKQQRTVPVKYRSTGLDKYSRDPNPNVFSWV